MNDRRPLLFNPQRASTQELEATLVRDGALLEQLEKDLLEDHRRGTPRHWQIVGPRGSGKSHLTELLARRMSERYGWSTVRLPEEHYQVASVSELLEQILVRLTNTPSPFSRISDPNIVEDSVLSSIHQHRKNNPAPILVVIENLGLLLERQLRSQRDQARLRQILTDDPPFLLIATATSYISATTSHSAPFYDFFQSIMLEDLSRAEVAELVEARARWDGQTELLKSLKLVRNQLSAIYHLSGGNPRLVVALYNVLRDGVTQELHTQLLQLLDEVTPYFQARIGDIPPQAARILTEMAVASGPILPAGLARRCRMPTNQVTAQLRKLQEQRLVVPGGRPDLRSRYYEVKDRLFRIWLQMREGQSTRGKLQFLTEFFQRWYAERSDDLQQAAQRLAHAFWQDLESGDALRCTEHLRTLDYLGQASRGTPDRIVLGSLMAPVDQWEDPQLLRTKLTQLDGMYHSAEPEDREHIGFVLAEVADKLGERERALAILREVVDRRPASEQVVAALLDRLIEDESYDEAWRRASLILEAQPRLFRVREAKAVAGIALGHIDESLAEASGLITETLCPNCRQRLALRLTGELTRIGRPEQALPIFQAAIGEAYQLDPKSESTQALIKIAGKGDSGYRDFASAAQLWENLSRAPNWFLHAGICTLSHAENGAVLALDFVSAAAEKTGGPLPQFAVDHLIDILAELKGAADQGSTANVSLEKAVTLVEQHTDPTLLAVAFRRNVPNLARTRPDLRVHLLNLYGQLRERGLLAEDISPYGEARAVMTAPNLENALMALHPEVRDAVILLLPRDQKSRIPKHLRRNENKPRVTSKLSNFDPPQPVKKERLP